MNYRVASLSDPAADITRTLRPELPDNLTATIAFLQQEAEKHPLYFPPAQNIPAFIREVYGNSRISDNL